MATWSTVNIADTQARNRLDAEFYRPDFLASEKALTTSGARPLASYGPDMRYGLNVEPEYVEKGLPFIRALNLKENGIEGEILNIPYSAADVGAENILEEGDILCVRSGANVGDTGFVDSALAGFTFGSYVIRIRITDIDPYYLYVFFKSKHGRLQTVRLRSGSAQPNISLPNLRELFVLKPTPAQQGRVREQFEQSIAVRRSAAEHIATAESLLMEALGLDHLDLTPQKCYVRPFRDLHAGKRFGAEYYMPCKKRVLDALTKLPHRAIADHAPAIRETWDPTSASKVERVRNFDITDALEPFLDDAAEPQSAAEIGSTKKRFRSGDVVISRLRSYLKEIAIVRTSDALPALGSSEFIVLRPTGHGISAETLMVFLRCPVVQTVLKWSQDGSNHPRFAEEDLRAIPVPDVTLRVQEKIDALVQKAIEARREAARLLEKAKNIVENLIAGQAGGNDK